MRRLYFTRAVLSGLAAPLACGLVVYIVQPLLGGPRLDPVGWLAARVPFALPAGVAGIIAALLASEILALAYALLWDVLPPRTRPVSKALVFSVLAALLLRLPAAAYPAAAAFGVVLGLVYRPHPAPPAPVFGAPADTGRDFR